MLAKRIENISLITHRQRQKKNVKNHLKISIFKILCKQVKKRKLYKNENCKQQFQFLKWPANKVDPWFPGKSALFLRDWNVRKKRISFLILLGEVVSFKDKEGLSNLPLFPHKNFFAASVCKKSF